MSSEHAAGPARQLPTLSSTDRLVELRILDGPNLYLDRPAIQLRLDVRHVLDASEATAVAWGEQLEMRAPLQPGGPRSSQRQAFAQRLVKGIVRLLSQRTGVDRLHVETRQGYDEHEVIVAFPWRRLGPAEELGRWVAYVLEDLVLLGPEAGGQTEANGVEWASALAKAVRRIDSADGGEDAHVPSPGIPSIGITGTNGKTTTTRLIAHLAMTAGKKTAWNSTDGVYLDGALVVGGDYAGFGGTGRVLEAEGVEFAVLEIARGGLLRRGMGIASLDVAVVTNVTPDHLGEMGIDTLDQLAEVKAIPVRAVRRGGWAVLNADDPRVLAMRQDCQGRICVFSHDPDSPGIREALKGGGRAVTVIDNHIAVLRPGEDPDMLINVGDVPITLAGLSRNNLANALAATAAGLSAGLTTEDVVEGLRTFVPDPDANPGRLNVWHREGVTIVVDIAHNEASYISLLEVCRGLCPSTATLRAVAGTIGDRTRDIIEAIGEAAGRGADEVIWARKLEYIRDGDDDAIVEWLQAGAARVGKGPFPVEPEEMQALDRALAEADPGDVVAFAVHANLGGINELMLSRGAVAATPAEISVLAKDARRG